MTLLSKNHFIQEPKPRIEDFCGHGDIVTDMRKKKDCDCFQIIERTSESLEQKYWIKPCVKHASALQDWKERNEKPEYELIAFTPANEPEAGTPIYSKMEDGRVCSIKYRIKFDKKSRPYFCLKESHDLKVKKYEENRVRYKGWEIVYNQFGGTAFKNDNWKIIFWSDGVISINNNRNSKQKYFKLTTSEITIEQFESLTGVEPDKY